MQQEYLTTKELREIFHVTNQTLMRWRNQNKLRYIAITKRKFLYSKEDIMNLLNQNENKKDKINVIYSRVSNTKQKNDLQKQKQILLDYCNSNGIIIDEIYEEIASGMNEERIQLNKLIDKVINNEIDTIYITYKDRLTRFGYEYFKNLFEKFNTKIVVMNNKIDEENYEKELTEDLISIIHHFSMKMYSNRRKQLKEIENKLKLK